MAKSSQSRVPLSISTLHDDDDDDFQVPPPSLSQSFTVHSTSTKPLNSSIKPRHPPPKTPRRPGKENVPPTYSLPEHEFQFDNTCSLDFIDSTIDFTSKTTTCKQKEGPKAARYSCNSIEARLMKSTVGYFELDELQESQGFDEFGELDGLIKLCNDEISQERKVLGDVCDKGFLVQCPLCGIDISELCEESRLVHTNHCLDQQENHVEENIHAGIDREIHFAPEADDDPVGCPPQVVDVSPVVTWLRSLGLERYEEVFVREEIDWDSLKWLSEEDILSIGITALGPRKKIVHALAELRKGCNLAAETCPKADGSVKVGSRSIDRREMQVVVSEVTSDETNKLTASKLITDFFQGSVAVKKKICTPSSEKQRPAKGRQGSAHKIVAKNNPGRKLRDIPLWCIVPGTPFRVDAFKYLRGDCAHWFLTHFHMDHYQGLTRSFCHGKIYCSLITAKLVNMKIGIPWDRIEILPLNQKIRIAGVDVTCLDANHCPGSVIILFQPPNGKAVLHTGDFRYCEEMANMITSQMCPVHTLILDTTYCNPQYDFPKQEAVIQFVIEAIQAETFNPKTLFLIGSYTIGKERLFLEVGRVLQRKVHVNAAKLRLLECLGFSKEDMQWFTSNEYESQIHVVPMWTLASFKRLKHISNQYSKRFGLIVAFSPSGWTFGKGKKKSPGKRWQQGTIIRYEVPYSEHSSYTELREFVKFVCPEKVIPSVNNDGPESADAMLSLLLS
ncbi:DNA cross-link repair protein SNM1 [Euphorbia peplus]|nr:DNA cross-link repair protein SNM1 [Euphorbia peplus]